MTTEEVSGVYFGVCVFVCVYGHIDYRACEAVN